MSSKKATGDVVALKDQLVKQVSLPFAGCVRSHA